MFHYLKIFFSYFLVNIVNTTVPCPSVGLIITMLMPLAVTSNNVYVHTEAREAEEGAEKILFFVSIIIVLSEMML